MPFELGSALLLNQAVPEGELARALFAVASEGVPLPRALVALGVMGPERLDTELSRADAPSVRHVVPIPELVEQLPPGLCARLLAVPIRKDPRTGTVDVAVADPRDPHPASEVGFFLKAPVRSVRAPLAEIEAALDRTSPVAGARAQALAPPIWVSSEKPPPAISITPIWGTPVPRRSTAPPPALRPASSFPPGSAEMPIPLLRRPADLEAAFPLMTHDRPVSTAPYGFAGEVEVRAEGLPDDGIPTLPFADPGPVLAAMRGAVNRDGVLGALVDGGRAVARKVALFVLKREAYVGYRGSPEVGDGAALRRVEIPVGVPSPFLTAATGGYLGPLYRSDATAPLLDVLTRTTSDVSITPVRVRGRAVALLLADELGDTALSTKRLEDLCRAAGEALARVLRQGKG